MSATIRNTRSCAPSIRHLSASSSFEYTENMPPSVDASPNVPKLQGGQAKTGSPSQSFDPIGRSSQPWFKKGDLNNDEIRDSVRVAFIPPRHNFVNKKKAQENKETVKDTIIPSGIIFELGQQDIVCGRGAPSNLQEGSNMFRELAEEHQASYLCSKRADKPKIAVQVMEEVRARGGRFVRRVKTATNGHSFGWEELDERRSYEKVCQALREGAPEIRRKMLSCSRIEQNTNQTSPPERRIPIFQCGSYSCRYDFFK